MFFLNFKIPPHLLGMTIDNNLNFLDPIYDEGTGVVFLVERVRFFFFFFFFLDLKSDLEWFRQSESSIQLAEINEEQPHIHFCNKYTSTTSQTGVAMLPKRKCDVMKNEIAKFLKLTSTGKENVIETISFTVPRKVKMKN